VDRHDEPLRLLPDSRGRFLLWCSIDEVPQHVRRAFIAAEDKRFYYHPGFDPIAIVRAFAANIAKRRIVSGASTLTQQVVRLIRPRPRTYRAKLVELLSGIKMEMQLRKDEILELYLNLAPMGGNIRGVGLAAHVYFGKDIGQINTAEAAVLAALPRSPSRYDPRYAQGRKLLMEEKDVILQRMAKLGWIDSRQLPVLLGSKVPIERRGLPFEAPHLVDLVLQRHADRGPVIRTTLDLETQQTIEGILHSHRDRLGKLGITQAGALVVSTHGPEVLAMVGSLGYGPRDRGYNDAVLAQRGAGSTLKPFLYALALEAGHNDASEIADTVRSYPSPHGDYLPLNANRRSYGPVTIRSALGNSLNLSAVKTLQSIGVREFYRLLKRLDIVEDRMPDPGYYGLGLAVGNMETSLWHLVQAYAALANEGRFRPLMLLKGPAGSGTRVISREAAYVISDILADPSARLQTFGNPSTFDFGFPVAVKTGTSTNYRDCWILAYTPSHVIGLWAGNFDGRPTNGATGASACGPILNEIIRFLYRSGPPARFKRPEGVGETLVCWMSGKAASPSCPYTVKSLVIGDPARLEPCRLHHTNHDYFELDAPYARWVHRREAEQGLSRFRLKSTEPTPGETRQTAGRPAILHDEARPLAGTSRISIVSPHDFDHFVLSPYQSSPIRMRAIPSPLVPYVVWMVDGMEIARTPPPYELFRRLTRGRHVVHAVTPDNVADHVTIQVE
ncbi:MAG: penicillin-binding protein 1C, partial [Deltaproteobacteria bacterium]